VKEGVVEYALCVWFFVTQKGPSQPRLREKNRDMVRPVKELEFNKHIVINMMTGLRQAGGKLITALTVLSPYRN